MGGEKEISVDVQIVAASNRDMEQMAQAGNFRTDLYHRSSVFRVILPPLREAVEDLDERVPLFVAEYNMDRFIIKTALEPADNNLTAAARALGVTRETLCYRVRKNNLKTVD